MLFLVPFLLEFFVSGLIFLSAPLSAKLLTPQVASSAEINLLQLMGYCLGSITLGLLSDNLTSRKLIFVLYKGMLVAGCVFPLLSDQRWAYMVYFLLTGVSSGPSNTLSFVILYEHNPSAFTCNSQLVLMAFATAEIVAGYLFSSFDSYTEFVIIIPLALTLLELFILSFIRLQHSGSDLPISPSEQKCLSQTLRLGASILLAFSLQLSIYFWIFSLSGFGIAQNLNYLLFGTADLLVNLVLIKLLPIAGKFTIIGSCLCSSLLLLAGDSLQEHPLLQAVLLALMKCNFSLIMGVFAVLLPMQFSNSRRGLLNNLTMGLGVLGGAVAPFLPSESKVITLICLAVIVLATLMLRNNKR